MIGDSFISGELIKCNLTIGNLFISGEVIMDRNYPKDPPDFVFESEDTSFSPCEENMKVSWMLLTVWKERNSENIYLAT